MTTAPPTVVYRERLIPNVWIFLILMLFFVPTVSLVTMPIRAAAALPAGIIVFLIVAVILVAVSPKIEITQDRLVAGRAQIPLTFLGKMKLLTESELKHEIGQGIDARNYLLVRGWLKQGVKIENTDASDPAPYWIITSRSPQRFANALREARDTAAAAS